MRRATLAAFALLLFVHGAAMAAVIRPLPAANEERTPPPTIDGGSTTASRLLADDIDKEGAAMMATKPMLMSDLQEVEAPPGSLLSPKDKKMDPKAREMREMAMRDAALSYGARGALGARTWEIRRQLLAKERYLDRVFNFRSLLISTGSGLLIEPPIIGASLENVKVETDGQQAAVADTIYNIGREAKIVTASRDWRVYLEREWGGLEPPPAELMPSNFDERKLWRGWVKQGWEEGMKQADAVFKADLDRLVADYKGMVRYRELLAQGMVSAPYALQVDRGVTGGGKEMRIGDRALQITGPSQLKPETSEWTPVNR